MIIFDDSVYILLTTKCELSQDLSTEIVDFLEKLLK